MITHAQNKPATSSRAKAIQRLNDDFRRTFSGGRLMMTVGVSALGDQKVATLLDLVRRFDDFNSDSDPHGEHDFGRIECDGQRFFWKIDYYDKNMRFGSEDPGDPQKTCRVLTIMLSAEY